MRQCNYQDYNCSQLDCYMKTATAEEMLHHINIRCYFPEVYTPTGPYISGTLELCLDSSNSWNSSLGRDNFWTSWFSRKFTYEGDFK